MVQKAKKLPRVFDYFVEKDQFAGGVTFCSGCPTELALRLVPKVMGKQVVMVGTPSCSAPVLHGQNIGSWHNLAYYSCVMTGVPSSATGLSRYYRRIGNMDATVVCFTGDGCAADVGFQPLSGAAERDEHFVYICYDNEGYMNTGVQRSSTTPWGALTATTPVSATSRGKGVPAKNLPLIMAMHKVAYAATATLSDIEDYAKKLLKAKEKKNEGFAYIHLFCPCPVGWGIESDSAIQVCRMAVRTNYFPLWEAERGKFRFTRPVAAPRPVTEYTRLIRKFNHLTEEELARLQEEVDNNFRFLRHLTEFDADPAPGTSTEG
jgi:pyruvate/2-oxoacid:ferredoxin oxidoreductase beta subunit